MYQVEGITASIVKRSLYDCTVENKKWTKSLLLSRVRFLANKRLQRNFEKSNLGYTYVV